MFKIKRALLSAAREKQTHKRIMVDQCGIALSFCPVDFYYMFLTEYHSEFNAACMQLLADALKKKKGLKQTSMKHIKFEAIVAPFWKYVGKMK